MASPVPSAQDINAVRRLVDEVADSIYSDADIVAYLERYPLPDSYGNLPNSSLWEGRWDRYAAAGDIWEEKAATCVEKFDFSADGSNFSRSQIYNQMIQQARRCRSRAAATSFSVRIFPVNESD